MAHSFHWTPREIDQMYISEFWMLLDKLEETANKEKNKFDKERFDKLMFDPRFEER